MKPSVGEQLHSARESQGISLDEAVKATNIRRVYLQELENDHPELLNSAVQARGFLRLYASFLGIPSSPLIAQWENQDDEQEKDIPAEQDNVVETVTAVEESEPASQLSTEIRDLPIDTDAPAERDKQFLNLRGLIERFSGFLKKKKSSKEEPEVIPLSEESIEPLDDISDGSEADIQPPLQSAVNIFQNIGAALHERRNALELTLSDVERFTNVKRMYLSAMEEGHFEKLPSTVQGRGMLNNYSKFLALDESWVMDAYAHALQSQRDEKLSSRRRPVQSPLTVQLNIPEKWRRIINPDLLIGGFFIIALFVFIVWGSAQVFSKPEPTATEAPSISEMLQQSPTTTPLTGINKVDNGGENIAGATPIPGVAVIESTPTRIATVNAAPLQLYIIAHDRAYMRINSDGEEIFNGRVLPDNVYTFSGQDSINLLSGSGAALEVYFNNEYLGDLGDVGEVVRMSFSLEGLSTPTPQSTQTPSTDIAPDAMDAMEAEEN